MPITANKINIHLVVSQAKEYNQTRLWLGAKGIEASYD